MTSRDPRRGQARPRAVDGSGEFRLRSVAVAAYGPATLFGLSQGAVLLVIPLWATHIGLSPAASSVIYGVAGAIDSMIFYPAGKMMDLYGRRWVAVPCVVIMGISFVIMPLTHGLTTLALVSMIMGFGNGIGSGIVMTLGADISPVIGRPTFLGIWRELSDAGTGLGPLILSAVTAVAGLGSGIVVSGIVGFAAAAALWVWTPAHPGRAPSKKPSAAPVAGTAEGDGIRG